MNFDLTDDQRAIQSTARDFLAARYKLEEVRRLALEEELGFTDAQWRELVGLGWPGLVVPEEDGGLGLGVVELTVVQEQLGYALAPTPFLSDVAAGLLLMASDDSDLRSEYLAPLAAGERRGTVALWDADAGWAPDESDLEPSESNGQPSLTGSKMAVTDAAAADFLVVAGAGGRHFLVDAGAPGLTIERSEGLDLTRRVYAVTFDATPARELAGEPGSFDRAYQAIATATAAESVGIAQRTMEMAVDYAKERKQFGRPIGSYQAVSHACAEMLLETEGARSVTLYAAWALDHEPESGALAAAMAKSYASEAGWRVAAAALQVHGGIG
ncbi:MAG TPA: acyl-CoA dehydrogenase family protein, partial [Solirubrobacteraceae bacterium]|nr:acyl-CoA dehydrogenase family protein [Solirubrobacteraceae bacterium]